MYNQPHMKKALGLFVLSILTIALMPVVALAARSPQPSTEQVGYDVSYPQCGKTLPTNHYFAIVGVNGGTAATTNSCLVQQLKWANTAKIGSKQPRVQLYVNTANPGEVISQITTWPTSNTDKTGFTPTNPYGICTGLNDNACSWQYGWNRSVETYLDRFVPSARAAGISQDVTAYTWWLDVETMNTWQGGSVAAQTRNTATIEGFAKYYQLKGAKVGLYSTAVQWGEITGGTVSATSNLNGLPNWRPSGASLSNAKANCNIAPLTAGGFISMTQYVVKNLDHNHSCL